MKQVDPQTLYESSGAGTDPVILDVLPDETFAKRHIAEALNVCVYEIDFIEKVQQLIPDKSRKIVVYGQDDTFEAAPLAYEKLHSQGWTQAAVLSGGYAAWKDLGYPIEEADSVARPLSGKFNASVEKSVVRWVGRNLLNQHNGVVGLAKATLELEAGRLVGGEAIVDMNKIRCEDIEDSDSAQTLINHLRTGDFFLVDSFPTARFELQSAEVITDALPGRPNYQLSGSFTLRGKTGSIGFPALLGVNDEFVALQASLELDRVRWNSKYGSGRIYEALGKHLVNDLITISFQLTAPIR